MSRTRRVAGAVMKSDLLQNVVRDLKSLKALWSHIFLGMYSWLAVWSALRHPEVLQTVITITGGVVSAVFAGYVFSRRSSFRTRSDDYRPPEESSRPSEEEPSD
jgi:hypothetical protein